MGKRMETCQRIPGLYSRGSGRAQSEQRVCGQPSGHQPEGEEEGCEYEEDQDSVLACKLRESRVSGSVKSSQLCQMQ